MGSPKAKRGRMGHKERKKAIAEIGREAERRRSSLEERVSSALAEEPGPPGPEGEPPSPSPGQTPAADALAAALPRLAAALPATNGGRAVPTDPEGLRRVRKAFEEDVAAAMAASTSKVPAARAKASARRKSLDRMVREQGREDRRKAERRRLARTCARSVYDLIGFDLMFESGMAQVEPGLYSETVQFSDVCYQSAREDEQRGIFDALSDILVSVRPTESLEYTLTNAPLPQGGRRAFFDPEACGGNAALAEEYDRILNDKMAQGSSNMMRGRYLSYSVEAPDPAEASPKLARLRSVVQQGFSGLGSQTRVLGGRERLELVASMTRPGQPYAFDYALLSGASGYTAKDSVCPMQLDFMPDPGMRSTRWRVDGTTWCQVLVMRTDFGPRLSDTCISSLMDLRMPIVVSWHLRPSHRAQAISMLMQRDDWIQSEVMHNQSYAIRKGYDYRLLPRRLQEEQRANADTLDMVLNDAQNLFIFSGAVMTWAGSPEELDRQAVAIVSAAHASGIELGVLADRQQEGLNSVLPLAHNHVDVQRDLSTSEATMLMPFVTQRLDMPGGAYYGIGPATGDMILVDRRRLLSPHGFISGMTGSGKSFAVKREIQGTILTHPDHQVYIMDVTGEYNYLVHMNDGAQAVKLGPDAAAHVNIFDMGDLKASGMSWQQAVAWKTDALLAATAALRSEGGRQLTQEERSVVARCVESAYAARGGEGADPPLLEDFWRELGAQPEPEAARLALVFERYVSGPMSFMSHASDADLSARILSFDSSEVPGDMRVFVMLANLESVRAAMYRNYVKGVTTWLYIDEFQSLFGHPAIVSYLARLWREGRKYGLICTGMTQSAAAMDEHNADARTIVDQSGFFLLLRQSETDRDFWVRRKGLSDVEAAAIGDGAVPGSGLLIADGARVPFVDDFPSGNALWDIFSTSPDEAAAKLAAMREG